MESCTTVDAEVIRIVVCSALDVAEGGKLSSAPSELLDVGPPFFALFRNRWKLEVALGAPSSPSAISFSFPNVSVLFMLYENSVRSLSMYIHDLDLER